MAEAFPFSAAATRLPSSLPSHGERRKLPLPSLSPTLLLFPSSSLRTQRRPSFSCSFAAISTQKRAKSPVPEAPVIREGWDDEEGRLICRGCGVFMQDADPNLPGYYQKPSSPRGRQEGDSSNSGSDRVLSPNTDGFLELDEELARGSSSKSDLGGETVGSTGEEFLGEGEEGDEFDSGELPLPNSAKFRGLEGNLTPGSSSKFDLGEEMAGFAGDKGFDSDGFLEVEAARNSGSLAKSRLGGGINGFSGEWGLDWEEEEEEDEEKLRKELDGFTPAGIGYGNVTEDSLKKMRKEKVSKSEKKKMMREAKKSEAEDDSAVIVCARCHSLRNYGYVKNNKAENLIPDFDFDRFVSTRLMKPVTRSPVVVMVVDCVDFDGSFPKRATKSLFKALEGSQKDAKLRKLPKLVLVATKVDLLPSQISPTRLDRWVRRQAKAAGAPKLDAVYLVSARKDLGVRNLISYIKELAGPRGNVWVIGAQNAGKSTLINAFAKREGVKITRLTEAAVPGTTLGILRITGILPAKAKMYDTPGLLHPYIMTMRLNREEQKMAEIRKELQPRTFRVKAGQSVHVGGLMRLDLVQASVQTIYVTVWASPNISLHLGKTENADEIRNNHFGIRLQPPIGPDRVAELGDWKPREIKVSGISWDVNSMDVAVSGLGWISLGLKGEATIALWTFDGIEVTQREPLVLDRARFLERPGFLLSKAISDAIGEESKKKAASRKLEQSRDFLLEAST